MPDGADAPLPGATTGAASQLDSFRHYRHLTVELAISQFKLRYTGSVLGYFWSLLKPAMIFAIMYFIFVDLFKINDGTQFYGMQVLLGIVVWTFFAECTSSAMQAIASNRGLIRKAYFPRSILVIAASLSALFTFVINLLIVFVIAVGLHQIDISLRIIVVLPLLLELYLLALGVSLFLAALFVQFHDVSHLWEVLMQLLFYASGVMFSLTYVLQRLHLALEVGTTKPQDSAPLLDRAGHGRQSHHADHRRPPPRPAHPQAPWTELVVTGHLAAVHQYAALDVPWEAPAPFLAVLWW